MTCSKKQQKTSVVVSKKFLSWIFLVNFLFLYENTLYIIVAALSSNLSKVLLLLLPFINHCQDWKGVFWALRTSLEKYGGRKTTFIYISFERNFTVNNVMKFKHFLWKGCSKVIFVNVPVSDYQSKFSRKKMSYPAKLKTSLTNQEKNGH